MALNQQQPANPAMRGLPATNIVSTDQIDQNLNSFSFPSNNNKIIKPKKTLKRKQSIVVRENTMSAVSSNFAKSKSSFRESPNFTLIPNTNEDQQQEIIDESTMSELSNQSNTSDESMERQNGSYTGRRYSFLDVDMDSILKFKLN